MVTSSSELDHQSPLPAAGPTLSAATWEYDAASGTVTLTGLGAYLGLPKAVNAGQLPDVEVPESVTYNITQEDGFMTVVIECGTGTFWTYKLVPAQTAEMTALMRQLGVI